MKLEPLKVTDLMLGNFISVYGYTEIVQGLVKGEKNWCIQHTGIHQLLIPYPDNVEFSAYGILLTEEWRRLLDIDRSDLPEHILYVHEAQNYFKCRYNIDISEALVQNNLEGIIWEQPEYLTIE